MSQSSFPKRAVFYLHGSKEQAYDKGMELGLKGEALSSFKYAFSEVQLTAEVDESGRAKIVEIDGVPLSDRNKTPIGKTMEVLRGTGRTTRMLAEAIKLAMEGKKVLIVMGNNHQVENAAKFLNKMIAGLNWSKQSDGSVVTSFPNGIGFLRIRSVSGMAIEQDEDLKFTAQVRGMRIDKVLFDHHAIELMFPNVVSLLHAFDPDMQPVINGGSREQ